MTQGKRYEARAKRDAVVRLKEKDPELTVTEIGARFGLHPSTVAKFLRQAKRDQQQRRVA